MMELESVEGEGTCFRFALPGCAVLDIRARNRGGAGSRSWISRLPGCSWLMTARTNLAVARAALGHFGITPDCVQDGHEAVAALEGGAVTIWC